MPEIAEVRTVAKTLNKEIVGRTIIGLDTPYSKIISGDIHEFKKNVLNKQIKNITTYGKWLLISLGDKTIMSHLRMEGKYFIKSQSEELNKHEHIIFHLDNGKDLRYHDTRKFGRMILVDTDKVMEQIEIKKLGIEPDDKKLNGEYIYDKIHKSNLPIKTLLLDQTIINGLGNIYVDEVLFGSNILPTRSGKDVTLEECEKIKEVASQIITKATKAGGTTIRSYTSSLGVYGTYQNYLMVHTKEGNKCQNCGTIILKTRVGGRGTYYCPTCQK